jgi:L-asparaginase
MVPFSLDEIEATSNLMLAFGYISSKNKKNIYIAMHGNIKKYNKILKNRTLGVFECQK